MGKTSSGVDIRELENLLKQSILSFEPRIIRKTLRVRLLADKSTFDHNALSFEIEGELYAEPVPIHLHLRTQLELENGDMLVQEFSS
jgi:predicted component of type VI protein secretion system